MKYSFNILFITSSLLFLFSFLSCSLEDSNKTNPEVLYFRLNVNDTIMSGEKVIKINDSTNMRTDRIDTLVLGKRIYFSAIFADDEALSLYNLKIDTAAANVGNVGDTIFHLIKSGSTIFNKKIDTIIRYPISNLPIWQIRPATNDTLLVRKGDYIVSVSCMDKAGNQDTISYKNRKIKIMSREEIIKARYK